MMSFEASRSALHPTHSLDELRPGQSGLVAQVLSHHEDDPISARLEELGFVPGEPLSVVALGPLGQEPMLIQIGYTRFALRRVEAQRVMVQRVESVS